jgi:hypothetical protein
MTLPTLGWRVQNIIDDLTEEIIRRNPRVAITTGRAALALIKDMQQHLNSRLERENDADHWRDLYGELVTDWNQVCQLLTLAGYEVYSPMRPLNTPPVWEWRSPSGEKGSEKNMGAAVCAAINHLRGNE